MKISHQPNPNAKILHQPNPNAKISHQPSPNGKISQHQIHLRKFLQGLPAISQPIFALQNANGHLCKLPTVKRETKGHLKFLFKDLQSFCLFRTTHPLLREAYRHLAKQFPHHSTPRGHQEEEDTSVSCLFQPWHASKGAIQTRPHLAKLGQVSPPLRIHLRLLRPRLFHLLRVGCPLTLLSANTQHRDHQLLHPQSHQYTEFRQREPGPQAPERHLGMCSLILKA